MREVAGGLHRGGLRTFSVRTKVARFLVKLFLSRVQDGSEKKSWLTKQRARAPACSPPRSHPRDPPSRPRAVAMAVDTASISPRAAAPALFASRALPASRPLAPRKPPTTRPAGTSTCEPRPSSRKSSAAAAIRPSCFDATSAAMSILPNPRETLRATPSPSASVVAVRRARARTASTKP